MQFFWGVFICDLQHHTPSTNFQTQHPRLTTLLSCSLLLSGLTIASYPEQKPEWQPWSATLHSFLVPLLPSNPDFPRFASGIGLELVALSIALSKTLRGWLAARPLLWLGRQSFAVYLLHGSMLRVVLVWMLYGVALPPDGKNDKGETVPGTLKYPGHGYLALCCAVWIPMVYGVAMLWTTFVDPWCARVTERLVEGVKLEKNEKGLLPNGTIR
jgi:peptidoglycan/LPS O-acetylase OafA/YrhL